MNLEQRNYKNFSDGNADKNRLNDKPFEAEARLNKI
jgi:hypothetical protein